MASRGRPKHSDILTPREWEVLALLREGLSNEQIAGRLGITPAGAKYHVSEILSKLGVSSREEAAAWRPDGRRERWALAPLAGKVAAVGFVAAAVAGLGLLAWGVWATSGGNDEVVAPPAVSPTPPAAPSQTVRPSQVRLVFARNVGGAFTMGELWMSDDGGASARPVTPEGLIASYAGIVTDESGRQFLYYVLQGGDPELMRRLLDPPVHTPWGVPFPQPPIFTQASLWRQDIETGDSVRLLDYDVDYLQGGASVDESGRFVAYNHTAGLSLLDVETGDARLLLARGDLEACLAFQIDECRSYLGPSWLPGGLLLFTTTIYEGGFVEVIDPFQEQPAGLIGGSRGYPFSGRASPFGDSACAYGQYAAPSSLYVFESPGWEQQRYFEEFEDGPNPEGGWVVDCGWLSEESVVALLQWGDEEAELVHVDTGSGQASSISRFSKASGCCNGSLRQAPEEQLVVAQFLHYDDQRNSPAWTRPVMVSLASGESWPVLEDGDLVLDAIARQAP